MVAAVCAAAIATCSPAPLRANDDGLAAAGDTAAGDTQARTQADPAPATTFAPSTGDYIIFGTAVAVAAGTALAPVPGWRFRGETAFDRGVRAALRPDPYTARRTAADASDLLVALTLSFPVLFDDLVTTWGAHDDPALAQRLVVVDAETIAVAAAAASVTGWLVARERPYAANGTCEREGELGPDNRDCLLRYRYRYRSFFSSHTTLAFAGAARICSHHARFALYGSGVDDATCIAALLAATATGTLRIVSDQHYATDTLTGAAVGALIGFGLPPLLGEPPPHRAGTPTLTLLPLPNGIALGGRF